MKSLPSRGASYTSRVAFPDARKVIARVSAMYLKDDLARGYREMRAEMLEWSETALRIACVYTPPRSELDTS